MTKKRIAIGFLAAAVLLAGVIVYEFLFGKLVPLSPVAVGFTKHESPHSVVYVQDGAAFDAFARVDALVPQVESFHALRFHTKPRLYVFRDKASYAQRSLSKARFCAFYNGFSSSVVIAPWSLEEARDGKISLEIYLRHELSHALINDNAGAVHAYYFPSWFLEGLAVYSTDQMGTSFYPSKEETLALIRKGNFLPPKDFKTSREDAATLDVPYRVTFMYSEFACIVDKMVETWGKVKLLAYMNALMRDTNSDRAFRSVYGVDFDAFVADFRKGAAKTQAKP